MTGEPSDNQPAERRPDRQTDELGSGERRRLIEKSARLGAAISASPDAIFSTSLAGTVESWNPAAEELFGSSARDALDRDVFSLAPASSHPQLRRALSRVAAGDEMGPFETAHQNALGAVFTALDIAAPFRDSSGQPAGAVWIVRDLTDLRQLETSLWETHERAETAFQMVDEAVIMADVEGLITYLNPVAERLTGWRTATAHGLPVSQVVYLVHEESRERVENPVVVCLRESRPVDQAAHSLLAHRDGRLLRIIDTASPVRSRDGEVIGAVLVLRVLEEEAAERGGSPYVADRDPLTGLYNRRELEHRLELALVSSAREDTGHALFFINLSQFRDVVDAVGRVAGDEMLKQVAALISSQVRASDVVARIRDDEFCLLLSHCPLPRAVAIAEQMRKTVNDFAFVWEGRVFHLDVRVGVVPVTADSSNASAALRIAEIACYSASDRSSGAIQVLDAHDINQIASSESQDLGLRIMKALTEERFRLYGQQIVSLGPPGMAGAHCEMLIHLVDEHGRDIPPGVFIPAAEREGMMRTLDRWVVRSVFRKLRDQPDPDVAVWVVNLSIPTLIDEGFPGFVNALQAEFQVSPRAICFEFDETVALANLGHVIRVIEALRPQGYAFCLSHFGVGMSTFSYLRTIQVDYVKIDGTLIRDVAVDTVDRAIVSGICHIAHVMGIRTIAGMVEDERLIDQLRALGLDYVQGFAVAEPEPITV